MILLVATTNLVPGDKFALSRFYLSTVPSRDWLKPRFWEHFSPSTDKYTNLVGANNLSHEWTFVFPPTNCAAMPPQKASYHWPNLRPRSSMTSQNLGGFKEGSEPGSQQQWQFSEEGEDTAETLRFAEVEVESIQELEENYFQS